MSMHASQQDRLTAKKESGSAAVFVGASNSLTMLPIVVFSPVLYSSITALLNLVSR